MAHTPKHIAYQTPALKVCGMRVPENIAAIGALQPAFMGFIFWSKSKRFVTGPLPKIADGIKKIGVFVNAPKKVILKTISTYALDGVQLHGHETPLMVSQLRDQFKGIIIKAFAVGNQFNFNTLTPYQAFCDYFLFDTKGKLPGGNGRAFSWSLLSQYNSPIPYFLSGGLGLEQKDALAAFLESDTSKMCAVLDVNSTFEQENFTKDPAAVAQFKAQLAQRFKTYKEQP